MVLKTPSEPDQAVMTVLTAPARPGRRVRHRRLASQDHDSSRGPQVPRFSPPVTFSDFMDYWYNAWNAVFPACGSVRFHFLFRRAKTMRNRSTVLAFLLTAAGGTSAVFAAEPLPVFVTAHYEQEAQVRSIAPRFQHLIVDRIKKTVQ